MARRLPFAVTPLHIFLAAIGALLLIFLVITAVSGVGQRHQRAAVGAALSAALGTPVTVGEVRRRGDSVDVLDIQIAGPPDVSAEPAIVIHTATATKAQLADGKLTIDRLILSGVLVNVDAGADGVNLMTMGEHLQPHAAVTTPDGQALSVNIGTVQFGAPVIRPERIPNPHLLPIGVDSWQMQAISGPAAPVMTRLAAQLLAQSLQKAAEAGYLTGLSQPLRQRLQAEFGLNMSAIDSQIPLSSWNARTKRSPHRR